MLLQDTDEFAAEAVARGKEILDIVNQLLGELQGRSSAGEQMLAAGKIYEIRQRFLLARAAYERVEADDPSAEEAQVRLAIVALKLNDQRRGLVLAQGLVNRSPKFTFRDISGAERSAYTVLGDAMRDNCDLVGAREAYEAAIDLVPTDEHATAHLAQALVSNDQIDEALDQVKTIVAQDQFTELSKTVNVLRNQALHLPAVTNVVNNSLLFVADNA